MAVTLVGLKWYLQKMVYLIGTESFLQFEILTMLLICSKQCSAIVKLFQNGKKQCALWSWICSWIAFLKMICGNLKKFLKWICSNVWNNHKSGKVASGFISSICDRSLKDVSTKRFATFFFGRVTEVDITNMMNVLMKNTDYNLPWAKLFNI